MTATATATATATEGSAADLQPGVEVAEIEFVDDSNELEEVKIYLSTAAVRGRLSRQAG